MKTLKCEGEELSLPSERSKPLANLQDASMLLYGEKKIGKTTFAAEFPDACLFFFEPGGKWLKTYNVSPKNWRQFKTYLKLLEAEPKKFRTVIIDTVDLAYKACYAYVCDKAGVDHPQDEDFGSVWTQISDEFTSQINFLLKLGRGVIFISHAEEKEIKTRGQTVTRITSTMPKQARKILEAVVDIWVYYRYDGDTREVVLRGNETISAGTRLKDNFVGVKRIDMGNSPREGYENFVKAFNKSEGSSETKASKQQLKIKIGGK